MNALMLGAAAVVLLLMKARGDAEAKPKLTLVPSPKKSKAAAAAAKAAAAKKPKPVTPHALVLSPAALPADTRSSALRAASQPVPTDMEEMPSGSGPLVDADGTRTLASPSEVVDPFEPPKPLAKPKKPKPPKKRGGKPPSAAKLSKPAKRSGKQAANDLKDYLDHGGQAGSRNSRSEFVRAAQHDMGGLTADGVYGPRTRARAKVLGVDIEH